MATHQSLLFNLLVVAYLLTCSEGVQEQLSKNSFPPGFAFGTASSSYQYEGATSIKYGRTPSIWDTFTAEFPEKIADGSSGEVANDFYHRYKEDIPVMKEIGFDSFRLSFSWSRILPRYDRGVMAPGRCSDYVGNCPYGDSATEPYKVVHHILLAHADVVDLYRKKFQVTQEGIIGIGEVSHWMEPKFQTPESREAAKRALDFMIGWVFDPVVFGDYPKTMRSLVGSRLPHFTKTQSELLKGSYDFLGLNYYTARYANDSNDDVSSRPPRPTNDMRVNLTFEGSDGRPIGPPTPTSWLLIYPKGFEDLVLYLKDKYNNPPLYILENGVVDSRDDDWLTEDHVRIKYFQDHLLHLLKAIEAGADVRGYYAWTLQDCFDWNSGFTSEFGLIHVDRENNLTRTRKNVSNWFQYSFFGKSEKVLDQIQLPTLLASA